MITRFALFLPPLRPALRRLANWWHGPRPDEWVECGMAKAGIGISV